MAKKVELKFIDHELEKDLYLSKKDLFNQFMGGFYDFILNHDGESDLESKNIYSKEEFLEFAGDWYADGKDSCYGLGFGFHKYYVTPNGNPDIKCQPTSTYLGYLYQNDILKDFVIFLVSFFAYWRNDEGCTVFDPYNKCDNMFVSSWAALVDTAKLFCLDDDTVYWWQSFRVKYCLNHIPGVILSNYNNVIEFENELELPSVRVAGYKFEGWHVSDNKDSCKVKKVNSSTVVYAELTRMDIYNYWEKEEKKIKKVEDPNWKSVDPA